MTEAESTGVVVDAALAHSRLAEALVAASPDAVVAVNPAGIIMLANAAVEKLFGYAPGDLLGQGGEGLLPDALRVGHVGRREQYAARPRTRPMGAGLRLVGRRKDGSEVPIDVGLAPVVMDDA